ncbi:MAG: GNAT family N-acetyltransferase [Pelosinus sp.]|nr:GNAT family N-acetyltransferase [Pelosinus sp.]
MFTDYLVRRAKASDLAQIKELLIVSDLPTVGVEKAGEHFLVADNGQVIGILGVLCEGKKALLRSFAVRSPYRSKGIGGSLVTAMLQALKSQNIQEVYLLTETATDYFKQIGFFCIDRIVMPENMLKESGLDQACPCSSKGMKYVLD